MFSYEKTSDRGGQPLRKRRGRGFSSVEFIVLAAVIVILSAVAINQGTKLLTNMRTNSVGQSTDTFIDACRTMILSEPNMVKEHPQTKGGVAVSQTAATADNAYVCNTASFINKLNEYLEDDMQIIMYDGGTTAPTGLSIKGLQVGQAGFYTAYRDPWGMHFRVEIHSVDNGATGGSGLVMSAPPAGTSADTEVRIFIKSYGKNGTSVPADFSADEDDIVSMIQYVNSGVSDGRFERLSKNVEPERMFINSSSGTNTFSDFGVQIYAAPPLSAQGTVNGPCSPTDPMSYNKGQVVLSYGALAIPETGGAEITATP